MSSASKKPITSGETVNVNDIITVGIDAVKVVNATPSLAQVNATPFDPRKAILIQPLTGKIKLGFTASSQSFVLFKFEKFPVPISEVGNIYIKSFSGSDVDVAIAEMRGP